MKLKKIDLANIDVKSPITDASYDGRIYGYTVGVFSTIIASIKNLRPGIDVKARHGNGIKECKLILDAVEEGTMEANFVEGMACIGGCVGGPGKLVDPEEGARAVDRFAQKSGIREAVAKLDCKYIISEI